MTAEFWQWLWSTDEGLFWRVGAGFLFFSTLAVWDIRRKGKEARRWREYLFLLAAVAMAMAFGVINDQITVSISWEYFCVHEGDSPQTMTSEGGSDLAAMRWRAVEMGLKATWTAGLILGALLLMANNPHPVKPQLSYRQLCWAVGKVFLIAGAGAVLLGTAGYFGAFAGNFEDIVQNDIWRPRRFMTVWSAHLGAYAGGGLAAIAVLWRVVRSRQRLAF